MNIELSDQELKDTCEALRYTVYNRKGISFDEHARYNQLHERLHAMVPEERPAVARQEEPSVLPTMIGLNETVGQDKTPEPEIKEKQKQVIEASVQSEEKRNAPKKSSKPKARRCANCKSTTTYMYGGYPRWHFQGHTVYCHKCYSSLHGRKK